MKIIRKTSFALLTLLIVAFLSMPVVAATEVNSKVGGTYTGTIKVTSYNESYILSYHSPGFKKNLAGLSAETKEASIIDYQNRMKMIVAGYNKISNIDTNFVIFIQRNTNKKDIINSDYIVDTRNSTFGGLYFSCLPTAGNDRGYWAQYNDKRYGETTVSISNSSINLVNTITSEYDGKRTYTLTGKINGKKISGSWSQQWDGVEVIGGVFECNKTANEENVASGTIQGVNTDASKTSGETSMPVPAAIAVGLAGVAAAVAGVGAAGAAGVAGAASGASGGSSDGGSSEEETEAESTYKMYIYKDFSDKIRYGDNPVFVYARMAEVTAKGEELERPDLTGQIEIFSQSGVLEIGAATMAGSYMGASVSAYIANQTNAPTEGVISFKFNGKGGIFQNNVKFQLIGEAVIQIDGGKLFALATSGRTFQIPYRLLDFMDSANAKVSVNCMQNDVPFTLALGKDADGNAVIVATDHAEKKPFESFFDSFSCEIVAESEKEYARTVFSVVMCYEGILADFLGKPKEIRGYKDKQGEMEKTLIAFKLGVWNDNEQKLVFVKPGDLEIDYDDDEGIFKVIKLGHEIDPDMETDDHITYIFKAELSFPSTAPVKGTLYGSCTYNGGSFDSETEISLIPDIQEYYDDLEEEYERCKYIINTYMTETWREKKLDQLEKARPGFGVKDYQLFRKKCWEFAQNLIMQEKQSYLQKSYAADIAIAYMELYVYIGDAAFDIAMMPVGGPIAGFLVSQAKSAVLELIAARIEKGQIGCDELCAFARKRVEQASGQADGMVAMPKPNEPQKLIVWLAGFFLYRFVWNWFWGKDENDKPIGITGALEKAALDFAGKGAAGLLGNYVDQIASKSNFSNAAKKLYSKGKDDELSKPVTDVGEKAFNELIEALNSLLEKIKSGLL